MKTTSTTLVGRMVENWSDVVESEIDMKWRIQIFDATKNQIGTQEVDYAVLKSTVEKMAAENPAYEYVCTPANAVPVKNPYHAPELE